MGLRFEIRPTHVEEDDSGSAGPVEMVLENAKLKASTLSDLEPDALVLGSDTTVALGERVLSKPTDMEDARCMLQMLSGRTHTVYTAVALFWKLGSLAHVFLLLGRRPLEHKTRRIRDHVSWESNRVS